MRNSKNSLLALPVSDLAEILEHSRDEWEALRDARFFITGGTGFFGKWILGALVFAEREMALGLEITVLSRGPDAFLRRYPDVAQVSALRFVAGSVDAFSGDDARCDFILHAATDTIAISTAAQEEARSRAIVEGTRRMIKFARRSRARRLLNVSSGAVYGTAAGKPGGASEDDYVSASPVTPYARAKREAEVFCAESGIDFVTARAFAFLGPHLVLDAHYAAGNFLRDADEGKPIVVRGDGTALRSYLYPGDLVTWLLRLLVRGRAGTAYNVGSDEVTSTGDLARRIAAACDPAPEVVVQSAQPHGPQNIYLPDVTRARTELGLEISVPLDEAIRRTLTWLK